MWWQGHNCFEISDVTLQVDYLILSERAFQQDYKPHLKKHELFGNSIKQKMLLESKALLWKECPTKCLIEISNGEI